MTELPAHLRRYPTACAIASLAARFGLPNTPQMQDWEWEVADPLRIGEFLEAYEHAGLDDDERFILAETLIESFENSDRDLDTDADWKRLLEHLHCNASLHFHSLWYWSCPDDPDPEDHWRVTPFLRRLYDCHSTAILSNAHR